MCGASAFGRPESKDRGRGELKLSDLLAVTGPTRVVQLRSWRRLWTRGGARG